MNSSSSKSDAWRELISVIARAAYEQLRQPPGSPFADPAKTHYRAGNPSPPAR